MANTTRSATSSWPPGGVALSGPTSWTSGGLRPGHRGHGGGPRSLLEGPGRRGPDRRGPRRSGPPPRGIGQWRAASEPSWSTVWVPSPMPLGVTAPSRRPASCWPQRRRNAASAAPIRAAAAGPAAGPRPPTPCRRADHASRAADAVHELLAVFKCYGASVSSVPQIVILALGEVVVAELRVTVPVRAWRWNHQFGVVRRRQRKVLQGHRRLSDSEIPAAAGGGSARLSAYARRLLFQHRGIGAHADELAAAAASMSTRTTPRGPWSSSRG